jgi:hypothetical protein
MTERSIETRIARSTRRAASDILDDLEAQLGSDPVSMLLFFAAPGRPFEDIAAGVHQRFGGPSMGCTTAGEICPAKGHCAGSVVALALRSELLDFSTRFITDAAHFDCLRAEDEISPMLERDASRADWGRFGLLLIDGLSLAEEQTAASLSRVLRSVPFVGGSAGDGLDFRETMVACDGRTGTGCAAFGLVTTALPFRVFHAHHFDDTDTRLVITGADPAARVVTEVNGEPAAQGYARAVGVDIERLSPQIFAAHPVLLSIGGNFYVRSIQKVNHDGSLTFYCAIDEGLPLRTANARDLKEHLVAEMRAIENELDPAAVIGFDCILRRLELMGRGLHDDIHQTLSRLPFVGFSTYGEQYNGLHVNQTLTGVAIGRAA